MINVYLLEELDTPVQGGNLTFSLHKIYDKKQSKSARVKGLKINQNQNQITIVLTRSLDLV